MTTQTKPGTSRLMRHVPAVATLVVALSAAALAAVATSEMALRTGAVSKPAMAWLVPAVIEGGAICAGLLAWQRTAQGVSAWAERCALGALTTLAVIVNAAHASGSTAASVSAQNQILGVVLAAAPPLILVGTVELRLRALTLTAHHEDPVGAPDAAQVTEAAAQVDVEAETNADAPDAAEETSTPDVEQVLVDEIAEDAPRAQGSTDETWTVALPEDVPVPERTLLPEPVLPPQGPLTQATPDPMSAPVEQVLTPEPVRAPSRVFAAHERDHRPTMSMSAPASAQPSASAQPAPAPTGDERDERAQVIADMLTANPDVTGAQVAERLGVSPATGRRLLARAREAARSAA